MSAILPETLIPEPPRARVVAGSGDIGSSLLISARRGSVSGMLFALGKGGDLSTVSALAGCNVVHLAAKGGHQNVINALIRLLGHGHPAFNARDDHGSTPIHLAARSRPNKALAATKVLLDAGASPLAKDALGKTPMQIANEWRNLSTARELMFCARGAGG